jgi:hypothetical protein
MLRQDKPKFQSLFAGKKLSTWLKEYPHIFRREGDYVVLAETVVQTL